MLIGSMQLEATSIDKKYKIIKITKAITSILSKQNAHFYEMLMCILFWPRPEYPQRKLGREIPA